MNKTKPCFATVQDTAFKFAHPLRVRIPQKFIKNKKRSNTEVSLLFWRAARDTGGKPPCVLGDRREATVPASHFATKNSLQDCFLNVAHPLRVRIPQKFIKKEKQYRSITSLLARCKGYRRQATLRARRPSHGDSTRLTLRD